MPFFAVPPPPPPVCIAARAAAAPASRPASIGSVTSARHPITVHWDREDNEAKAASVLGYAELAWDVQVLELGFPAPYLPDGDIEGPELDIYLTDRLAAMEAWVWSEEYTDQVAGDGLSSTWGFIALSADLPDDWVANYTVHEFNHVLQHATDFTESTYNVWEATAVAAQYATLGEAGFWEEYVADYQGYPWAPALVGDGYYLDDHYGIWSYFEYGAGLWVQHVDRVVGAGDGTALAALWLAAANEGSGLEPDIVDAALEVTGQDLPGLLNGLARTRWLVGDRWDDRGLPEAAGWGPALQVPVDGETSTAQLPVVYTPVWAPQITGQAFVQGSHHGDGGTLTVEATSEGGLHSGVLVLWWGADGSVGEASPVVDVELAGVERFVVALSNAGPPGWDGDDMAYVDGDQQLAMRWTPKERTADTGEAAGKGCGCASGPSPGWGLLWGLAALAVRRRRGGA